MGLATRNVHQILTIRLNRLNESLKKLALFELYIEPLKIEII